MAEITPIDQRRLLFYDATIENALQACLDENCKPADMITIADERIAATKDSPSWKKWLTSTSIRATGYTKQGNAVVVYAHDHPINQFGDPARIMRAKQEGLILYAARLSQPEFQAMVDADEEKDVRGNRLIWVGDYDAHSKAFSGAISVNEALSHPQTIPFLGGGQRAHQYVQRHKKVFGKRIGVWHIDDLNKDTPVARLLYLGDGDGDGLDGSGNLNDDARILGVREGSAAGAQKSHEQSLEEQLMQYIQPFLHDPENATFRSGLRQFLEKRKLQ